MAAVIDEVHIVACPRYKLPVIMPYLARGSFLML